MREGLSRGGKRQPCVPRQARVRSSPGREAAQLQFQLQFPAVPCRSGEIAGTRWPRWNGSEREGPELLMRFGLTVHVVRPLGRSTPTFRAWPASLMGGTAAEGMTRQGHGCVPRSVHGHSRKYGLHDASNAADDGEEGHQPLHGADRDGVRVRDWLTFQSRRPVG
jgi:hypothetical protein